MEDKDAKKEKPALFFGDEPLPTTLTSLANDKLKRDLEKERILSPIYRVKTEDVVCGNHGPKELYRHPGNERFRVVVEMRMLRYSQSNRRDKSEIVREIVDSVRAYGGGFVRFDDEEEKWTDIGNGRAREKAGK
jgi:hypothetical protein